MLNFDNFSQHFSMKIDGDDKYRKSISGALCSIIVLLFITVFAKIKIDTFLYRKDAIIMSTINDYYFKETD